jgi:hypothetical protein
MALAPDFAHCRPFRQPACTAPIESVRGQMNICAAAGAMSELNTLLFAIHIPQTQRHENMARCFA